MDSRNPASFPERLRDPKPSTALDSEPTRLLDDPLSQTAQDLLAAKARLNAVIEIGRAEQAQRASESRYRTLFEYAPDGFIIADPEGRYIDANLPAEMLTLVDAMIDEASVKLKTLGDLETVSEKEMVVGVGIDYPGAGS